MDDGKKLFDAIEAGGTKFSCLIGSGPGHIRARARIETITPGETFGKVLAFFRQGRDMLGPLSGLGIGSFGPLDLNPSSPAYGHITDMPKPGWANAGARHGR
ncbi:hypothetical protein CLG96_11515 [Sphingomonas oleivorans]|uniref:Uncharacterized protein n=1 Tax=Sphingomonas oleivorans TaxID=1735121 RepID=A0A2T5FVJ8_9SPHN|nr:ROK family protein [Sphingomonas oleivorans]PTQ09801.1 hypothetical protein CLG96_11515 [Sphingomonas oleivorans]